MKQNAVYLIGRYFQNTVFPCFGYPLVKHRIRHPDGRNAVASFGVFPKVQVTKPGKEAGAIGDSVIIACGKPVCCIIADEVMIGTVSPHSETTLKSAQALFQHNSIVKQGRKRKVMIMEALTMKMKRIHPGVLVVLGHVADVEQIFIVFILIKRIVKP
ncbi:hypothetical protein [Legionella moravica]|uniref:hypothetical protein n=1 Tax=Legionella moravica TaxID=39962 RepID=UPI001A9532DD|nr:hypothetical protein [Legionella moravica]